MSAIKGTNVLAPVVPFDTTDTHASHEARYGKGGYRSVQDNAERDAIPALRREAGMLVAVIATGKTWKLGEDLTTWTEFTSGVSSWSDLQGKPSTFTPSAHTHTTSDITGFAAAVAAAAPPTTDAALLTSGTLSASRLPASVVLTNDSRLSDARQPLSHSHGISDVSGLQSALDAKATPASVTAAVAAVVNAAPASLDTLAELASALNSDASFASTVTNALAAKAPTASPTFTGTVSGITKGMVGLGNVDNTADASKPVSTAQAAADAAVASAAASDATSKAAAAQAYAVQRANHTGTQTAATISDFASAVVAAAPPTTNASLLTSGTLDAARLPASAVLTTDSRLSDARTPTAHSHAVADVTGLQAALDGKQAAGSYAAASHTHPLSSLTQSGATTGQVVTWSGSAWAAATPASGGSSSLVVAASVSAFPATGSASVLYLAEDTSRLYQWESPVYVEVGGTGGGFAHAATHATGGGDEITPASIGAAAASHTHAYSSLTGTPSSFTPSAHASSHAAAGGDPLTLSASQISGLASVATSGSASDLGSGTVPFARLPVGTTSATVAAGNDSRLTDTRTPTDGSVTDAKITSGGLSTSVLNWSAIQPWAANTSYAKGDLVSNAGIAYRRSAAGTSGATFNIANWQQITPSEFVATQITSGTLPDARLSTNVPLLPAMMLRWSESSATSIDVIPRPGLTLNNVTLVSGSVYWTFVTPLVTLTVSQITMGCLNTAASGLTLARMGLFTYDESTATLVARTASDTTLFTSTRTLYTRSLDTTGGYPSTYTLVAGTRYGVAVICTGTTMPALSGVAGLAEIVALSPRVSAVRSSQSDLGTISSVTTGSTQYPWARLS